MTSLLPFVVAASGSSTGDELYLQFRPVNDTARLAQYRALLGSDGTLTVVGSSKTLANPIEKAQLEIAASELKTSLTTLLGQAVHVACCDNAHAGRLTVEVLARSQPA